MRRRSLLLFLALLVGALPAAARSLVIESFDADILVRADGSIVVTETIRPRFTGSWNGIYRTIPVDYRTPQGFSYKLLLEPLSVTDGRDNLLRTETSRERHYLKFKIWVPGARDATRTVLLRYRVANALRFFEEHDELYWNVTGDEWEVPLEAATALITLPSGVTGVRAVAFTGAYGSRAQDADVEIAAPQVRFRMRRRLSFREGLTAVVGWDKGFVNEPGFWARVWFFLRSNWAFALPVGVFGLMFGLWYTRGRDPRLRPIAPRYAPPEGLTPAEAGTLIDNAADLRDITATLVDLAVRGYLTIEETEEKKFLGLLSDKDYLFHLRKPIKEWKDDLKPHERSLLTAVFYDSSGTDLEPAAFSAWARASGGLPVVQLSELENKFYKKLPGIRDCIFDELLARRYYLRRPDKAKRFYVAGGIVVGGLSIWGGGFLASVFDLAPLTLIAAGVLSGAIVLVFGWFMPARTRRGVRAVEGVMGFEEFLSRVEADRYDRMIKTPEMFEKYLPFAMAFGVEKNWVRAFEDIYRRQPDWYVGPYGHTFSPHHFVADLGRMSSALGTTMASSPRGSGGSGFGGGGFSGGGFGGGGGGGF